MVVTDQDEGEGLAVVAVATAVAGGCGKIAAAREAEAGWMRLDEDAAGGQRARASAQQRDHSAA